MATKTNGKKPKKNTLKTGNYTVGYGKPPVEYQYPPGVSGNPGGRPKLLSDAYKEYLATVDPNTGRTRAQDIAMAQGVQALHGETSAAKELRQATEGDTLKVFQQMTDAELDQYIADRQREIGGGVDDKGATQASEPATSTDEPSGA